LRHVEGEHEGVRVQAWLAPAEAALRSRGALHVVVRRRVVREPNVAKIVAASFGEALSSGRHPVACVVVDPPRGEVDVNVHPQKAEVRFEAPQRVYAAVRAVLGTAESVMDDGPAIVAAVDPEPRPGLGAVLDRWASSAGTSVARESSPGYRLRTRAAGTGYGEARQSLRAEARVLHDAWLDDRAPDPSSPAATPSPDPGPEYLGCLPGPVGLFVVEGELLAVDLRALRSHLLLRRLQKDFGGGEVAAQGLIEPVVVRMPGPDVARCIAGQEVLARLGLHLEAFGDDAVIVRAVPALLRQCIDRPDVADLVVRVLPWLRVREHTEPSDDTLVDAMRAMAQTLAPDPAPRLARRWLRELCEQGVALDEIPGLRRWSAAALTVGK